MEANHRTIMERYLGRRLNRTEIIHHIDGDADNNNIENLKIVTAKQHRKEIHPKHHLNDSNIMEMINQTKTIEIDNFKKSLSELLSLKQADLLYKKVMGIKLTKTESEYYSRTVKAKIKAMANDQIYELAKSIKISG